jgi:glycosyltransferase involved in cell wall biosynthesis
VRVCLVSFSGYPDQGATFFYEMARSLGRLGLDVDALAVRRGDEALDEASDGVHVIRVPVPLGATWASPSRWVRKLQFFCVVAARIRGTPYDIVHVYSTLGAFALPLLAGRRPKWVHELQTGAVSSRSRLSRWAQNRVRAWQGALFDANLAVTAVLGQRLFRGRRHIDVVPAGVNLEAFTPGCEPGLRSEMGVGQDAVVFVHAGVLEEARATDVPVRALARALVTNERLWLLMPGRGSQLAALRRLAHELGVAERVWLPGYLPYGEMPRVFRAADAGLSYLPAVDYYEGQPPMKVMEYLAAGLPVLASDVASHRMLVVHGDNGLLAAPDEASYSELLLKFAGSSALRQRLATRARASVTHLSWDRIASDRLLPIYRRLLAKEF